MSDNSNFTPPEEANIERLLRHAAQPEPIDPAFLTRVQQRLVEVAGERGRARQWRKRGVALAALAASVVVGCGLLLWALKPSSSPQPTPPVPSPEPELVALPPLGDILPRPADRPLESVVVGSTVRTSAGERRRVRLPDDTVVTLNENTEIHCPATRQLALTRGEVFVEVSPRTPGQDGSTFAVQAAGRAITALGTRFAVCADDKDARVLVTQGKVRIDGLTDPVQTGEQWTKTDNKIAVAPRATHALAWARDVLTACETPLIPPSAYSGGALVAQDPMGQEQRLSLRKYHVDVHIENGFVRTTIDQTYFNHQWGRLEGTFYFPLPADASLARLAMYVDGTRNEGGMVERDYGRSVYENIVRKMQDPALLEWVDGTTFKMRVFPLEGRQEKRIILCYTQKLASAQGKQTYRFPAGHSLDKVGEWSFHARVKDGAQLTWHSPSHDLQPKQDKADLLLAKSEKDIKLDRDVVIELSNPMTPAESDETGFAAVEHDGARYLMLRHRPHLAVSRSTRAPHGHWVFVVEHGSDRDSVVARAQIEILRAMLTHVNHDDTFSVVAASHSSRLLNAEPLPATPAHAERVLAELEQLPLLGAFDMSSALKTAATAVIADRPSTIVHLGSAQPRLGERREDKLAELLPASVPYVGVGVGKHWSRTLMKRLADRSGGHFTQINPDEPLAWRGFDLLATLTTPRLLDVKVQAEGVELAFLSDTTTIAQGEEFLAVARLDDPKQTLPESVVLTGTLEGKAIRQILPIRQLTEGAKYLPRHWCKLEIDRLLAEDSKKHKDRIIHLSKALYVMSPYTSLLVLENEAMYQQYKVEQGKPEIWAPYVTPQKIPVVYEPLPGTSQPVIEDVKRQSGKRTHDEVCQSLLQQNPPRFVQLNQPVECAPPDWNSRYLYVQPTVTRLETVTEWKEVTYTVTKATPGEPGVRKVRVPVTVAKAVVRTSPAQDPALYNFYSRFGGYSSQGWAPQMQSWSGSTGSMGSMGSTASQSPFGRTTFFDTYRNEAFLGESWGQGRGWPSSGEAIWKTLPPQMESNGTQLYDYEHYYGSYGNTYRDLPLLRQTHAQKQQTERDRRIAPPSAHPLLYQRPYLDNTDVLFRDLLLHAPGLSTTSADVQATLEAEAIQEKPVVKGKADPRVEKALQRARVEGWRSLEIPATARQPGYTVTFDGTGCYRWERKLDSGLKEEVVCNGETLWHLYPEIGLGGKRTVSRSHRLEIARLVPVCLPALDDLLHGADVTLSDDRTIAVVAHSGSFDIHYILDDEGKLAERRLIHRKTRQVVQTDKVSYGKAVDAPSLRPKVDKLVVLPMPARSWNEVTRQRQYRYGYADKNLPAEHRLALILAATLEHLAADQLGLIRTFIDAGDRRPGFFTLLAATRGIEDALNFKAAKDAPGPLGLYLEQVGYDRKKGDPKDRTGDKAEPDHFCHHLKRLAELDQMSDGRIAMDLGQQKRLLAHLDATQSPELIWAVAQGFMALKEPKIQTHKLAVAVLDVARKRLADMPLLGPASHHEWALALAALDPDAGGKAIEAFHHDTVKTGALPPADPRLIAVLGEKRWESLMRANASELNRGGHQLQTLVLVAQLEQMERPQLGSELRTQAVESCTDLETRFPVTEQAVHQLRGHQRYVDAERLVEGLLGEKAYQDKAEVWQLAMLVARENGKDGKAVRYMEKAMDLDWTNETPRAQASVRGWYSQLLSSYESQIIAARQLDVPPPVTVEKARQASERWRKLDPHPDGLKHSARLLATLGDRDRAWGYLTMAFGTQEATSATWVQAAHELQGQRQYELADRALQEAIYLNRDDRELLREQESNWIQAGERNRARQIRALMEKLPPAPVMPPSP